MGTLNEPDRPRCGDRLAEVFNRLIPADQPSDPSVIRYDVPEGIPLGRVRVLVEDFFPRFCEGVEAPFTHCK
jgi:hypothetical protein